MLNEKIKNLKNKSLSSIILFNSFNIPIFSICLCKKNKESTVGNKKPCSGSNGKNQNLYNTSTSSSVSTQISSDDDNNNDIRSKQPNQQEQQNIRKKETHTEERIKLLYEYIFLFHNNI